MEKIKLLLYCTKNKNQKDLLWSNNLKHFFLDGAYNRLIDDLPKYLLNGKIVAECDYEVEEIKSKIVEEYDAIHCEISTNKLIEESLFDKSCLNRYEMFSYLKNDFLKKGMPKGYAIHIKNLNIFDKPRELENYVKKAKNGTYWMLDKAPQNMMACYKQNKEKYILISIRAEWLCKILNNEKTIEIRKKVLKEMITDA